MSDAELRALAEISQELSNIQMMFFITVLVVLVIAALAVLIIRNSQKNWLSASEQVTNLIDRLGTLSDRISIWSDTFNQFNDSTDVERRDFWNQNVQRHERILRVLATIADALTQENLLDTDDMKAIREDLAE